MSWRIKNGVLLDENGDAITVIPDNLPSEQSSIISCSKDMYMAIVRFVTGVESGSFKKKKAYNEFKEIIKDIHK